MLRQGLSVQLATVAVPQPRLRRAHPAATAADGAAADAPLTPELAEGRLRTKWEHRGSRRIDCQPRKPIRPGADGAQLHHRRRGLRRAGAGRTKEAVLDVLSRMATNFRTRVGESLASVEQHSTPLAEATTPSLDALKAYSAAYKVDFSAGTAAAAAAVQACRGDRPGFAIAHAHAGASPTAISESPALSMESTIKAYQLRDRASDRERFFITAMYDRQVTGNLEREQQTLESWAQTYPRDPGPHGLSVGFRDDRAPASMSCRSKRRESARDRSRHDARLCEPRVSA